MAQNNSNDQKVQNQKDQQTPQKPTVVEGLVKDENNKEQTPETNRTKEHDDTNHPHKQDTPKTERTQHEQPQQEVDPNRTTL